MRTTVRRTAAATVALLACAAALVLGLPAAGAATGTLNGTVGVGGDRIAITKGGRAVTTLKKGTYTLKVRDVSDEHNFRLLGPGVNKATSVDGTGSRTWTVTLKPGTYTVRCDPHRSSMKKTFRVVA